MKYTGTDILLKKKATTQDAVDTIIRLAQQCAADPLAHDLYKIASGANDPYQAICEFAYNAAFYEPNPTGHQRVRTMQRSIVEQRASCTDYTVMIAAILLAGGEPVTLKLVNIDGDGYGHIYPVAGNGRIMDVVPCQDQSGNEYLLRDQKKSVYFDRETPYKSHKLYQLEPMKLSELNGTNTINATNTINGLQDFDMYTVDGCDCVAVNGSLIPMELNGVRMEAKPADVSAEDYATYMLAVSLGDPAATNEINGLRDFLAKRKAKQAQRKKSAQENRAARQSRRAKRREKFGELVDVAKNFVAARGEALRAETRQAIADVADAGIDPSDEGLRALIDANQFDQAGASGGSGGLGANTPLLIGGAALLAFLLFKKK